MDTSLASTVYQNYDASNEPCGILTNNSQKNAMLLALAQLQKKLGKLEAGRMDAENIIKNYRSRVPNNQNLRHSRVNFTDTDILNKDKSTTNFDTGHLSLQLTTAEIRCQMLEHQISFMKKLLSKNIHIEENDPNPKVLKALSNSHDQTFKKHLATKKCLLNTIKKKKIYPVTSKKSEDHSWCTRARCSACAAAVSQDNSPRKGAKKDVRFNDVMLRPKSNLDQTSDKCHHHLMPKDLPFVVGQATSDSHSVTANIQKVFSMLNEHNSALCTKFQPKKLHVTSDSSEDLNKIINDLQNEFTAMNFEYQELKHHSEETIDKSLKRDLEKEEDDLIQRMGLKREQINKLRNFKNSQSRLCNTNRKPAKKSPNFHKSSVVARNLDILKGTKNLISTLQQSR